MSNQNDQFTEEMPVTICLFCND